MGMDFFLRWLGSYLPGVDKEYVGGNTGEHLGKNLTPLEVVSVEFFRL